MADRIVQTVTLGSPDLGQAVTLADRQGQTVTVDAAFAFLDLLLRETGEAILREQSDRIQRESA